RPRRPYPSLPQGLRPFDPQLTARWGLVAQFPAPADAPAPPSHQAPPPVSPDGRRFAQVSRSG
ncbi:hypothetical protein PV359_35430, partial [Streptomyces stelliscabiei]|nr:hypothetical protein [Streptomyces stelliscabiei]